MSIKVVNLPEITVNLTNSGILDNTKLYTVSLPALIDAMGIEYSFDPKHYEKAVTTIKYYLRNKNNTGLAPHLRVVGNSLTFDYGEFMIIALDALGVKNISVVIEKKYYDTISQIITLTEV